MEDRHGAAAGMRRYFPAELPEGGEAGSKSIGQLTGRYRHICMQQDLLCTDVPVVTAEESGHVPGFFSVLAGAFIVIFPECCGEMFHGGIAQFLRDGGNACLLYTSRCV